MRYFVQGHKKVGGRQKGGLNKVTLLQRFDGFTEEDKNKVYRKAIELAEKGSVAIILKLLDKMLSNAIIDTNNNETTIPDINDLTDIEIDNLYNRLTKKNVNK